MTPMHDIVIIGGGAVGSSLALALQCSGFDVALVDPIPPDKRSDPAQDNRVFALAPGSKIILDRLAVWPLLHEVAAPIKHIHVSNKGSFGAVRLHAKDYDYDALGFMLASSQLQRGLNECLSTAPVTHYCPASFQSMHVDSDCAHIQLSEQRCVRARLVVAADGMHSPVRALHHVGSQQRAFGQQAIVALVQLTRDHEDVAFERFLKNSAIALLPYGERQCALIWSVNDAHADVLLALDDTQFLKRLQCDFGYRLGRLQSMSQRMSYPLFESVSSKAYVERVVFVGNAMQSLHPIAAQGFNLALRNVALLTDVLVRARSDGDDWSADEVLARYAQMQDQDLQRTRSFTNALVGFFDDSGVAQFKMVRGALLRAFDCCPPAKRYLLSGMMKGVDLLAAKP